jgi:ATP-binding cassette subfamily B protein RaxB
VVVQARADTVLLETIRAMTTVRAFGGEQTRVAQWTSHALHALMTRNRLGLERGRLDEVLLWLSAIEYVMIIGVGVDSSLAGTVTVGGLVAVLSYRGQFASRLSQVWSRLGQLPRFSVMKTRLDEIMAMPKEVDEPHSRGYGRPEVSGPMFEMTDVQFRYSPQDPLVLKDITLRVDACEVVVVVGVSGIGKTTLLKNALCLLTPDSGSIRWLGRDLSPAAATVFRQEVAAVLQDDRLLAGTLIDNIALFDFNPTWRV